MAKNKLHEVLADPNKLINRPKGVPGILSKFFRIICRDLNMDIAHFNAHMHDFILDPRNGVPDNRQDQISLRGNLTKEFAKERMTWKVFCKALSVLKFRKIELAIRAYHYDGRETVHGLPVTFGGNENLKDFLDGLKKIEDQEDDDNNTEEEVT